LGRADLLRPLPAFPAYRPTARRGLRAAAARSKVNAPR